MKHIFSVFRRYFRRSSESGQSVILLALGFIGLAGFVGITTDISLMFVRYAQLSRAVDSAAIASANQMRQDRSNATVQLAARQFIEFYGVSPESVIVDTCLTTNFSDPDLCTDDQAKLVRVRAYFRQPTVFMRLLGVGHFDMWVSAISQTAALDVVIVMDVSESMAAQTTIGDWAATEKLGASPGDASTFTNYGVIYRPPNMIEVAKNFYPAASDAEISQYVSDLYQLGLTAKTVPSVLLTPQITVNNFLTYYPMVGTFPVLTQGALGYDSDPLGYDSTTIYNRNSTAGTLGNRGINDTNKYNGFPEFRVDSFNNYFTNARFPGKNYGDLPSIQPRAACRIRFYPRGQNFGHGRLRGMKLDDGTFKSYAQLLHDVDMKTEIQTDINGNPVLNPDGTPARKIAFDGFIPSYNYYGCCNDPDDADGFDDLVCQPFKEVRGATFDFLDRIDFLRGDRAAFVTYNRSAVLVNPYAYTTADPKLQTRPGAMLDSKEVAYKTLKNLIGVNAEPFFYVMTLVKPTNTTPLNEWEEQSYGVDDNGNPIKIKWDRTGYNPAVFDETVPEAVNYPVFDNCAVQNAMIGYPRTLFKDGFATASLPTEFLPAAGFDPTGYSSNTSTWLNHINAIPGNPSSERIIEMVTDSYTGITSRQYRQDDASYEYWAACRSGNVGAALREANNALLDPLTSRSFGTIWIVVLMSDGGAGGSDPVRRNGRPLRPFKPYFKTASTPTPTFGVRGEYGAFGLCPIGTPAKPGELIDYHDDIPNATFATTSAVLPNCADEKPATRHTCDFRPLITLPTHKYYEDYKRAGRDPMEDDNYKETDDSDPQDPNLLDKGTTKAQEVAWNKLHNTIYDVDIGVAASFNSVRDDKTSSLWRGGCDMLYDVEDYARDWADYIAIANLGTTTGSNSQVPTVFTIGFAIQFDKRIDTRNNASKNLVTDPTKLVTDPVNADSAQLNAEALCEINVERCLGEQLLRYIADVGDNNRIDNDYYQDLMYEWYDLENGGIDPGTVLKADGYNKLAEPRPFGSRDACQVQDDKYYDPPVFNTYDLDNDKMVYDLATGTKDVTEFSNEWGQLRANISCGNYYYSPNADQLQFVFDDIASRMFTRLSR